MGMFRYGMCALGVCFFFFGGGGALGYLKRDGFYYQIKLSSFSCLCPDYCNGSTDIPAAIPQRKKNKLAQMIALKLKEAININTNAVAVVHLWFFWGERCDDKIQLDMG